jgi:acetyl esterase/lipase
MSTPASMNAQPMVIPLWPDCAPGSEGSTQQECESIWPPSLKVVRNVARPTLTAYFPDPSIANGTAMIVCPGGAFHFLSIDMEGTDVARWLSARGVTAFVLKYRLIRTGDEFAAQVRENMANRDKMAELTQAVRPLAIADGRRAVQVVRERAAEWGIAPDRIGIMGFSAGGTVTVSVTLEHDVGSRPDFAAAIYGGSSEKIPVPADAPPIFVLCAADDAMAAPRSVRLYSDWTAAGRTAELHIYAQGGHGFGMRKQGLPTDTWIERFADWLEAQGLLDPPSRA